MYSSCKLILNWNDENYNILHTNPNKFLVNCNNLMRDRKITNSLCKTIWRNPSTQSIYDQNYLSATSIWLICVVGQSLISSKEMRLQRLCRFVKEGAMYCLDIYIGYAMPSYKIYIIFGFLMSPFSVSLLFDVCIVNRLALHCVTFQINFIFFFSQFKLFFDLLCIMCTRVHMYLWM